MRNKITPEYVLNMLKEVKELADNKKFKPTQFSKKYPTYPVFNKILYQKGLIKKQYGEVKWISILPNVVMSKEILKLYLIYGKEIREKYKKQIPKSNIESDLILEKLETKKNETRPQTIEVFSGAYVQGLKNILQHKKEHIEALQEEIQSLNESYTEKIESLKRKYNQLQDELAVQRNSLLNKEAENSELKETIQSREEEIEKLVNRIKDMDYPLSAPTYDFPDFSEPEVSDSQVIVTTPKSSKTYKILGIPVFSINNK